MKRLILPFGKSLFCSTLLLFACHSVRSLQRIEPPVAKFSFSGIKLIDRNGGVVANVISLGCDFASPLYLRVRIASAVHDFELSLLFTSGTMRAELNEFVFDLPAGEVAGFREALCHSASRWGNAYVNAEILHQIEAWLQVIAPPCQLSYLPSGGFYCALEHREGPRIKSGLVKLQAGMTRWQRQPYLITRRLALALELANIVTTKDLNGKKQTSPGIRKKHRLASVLHHHLPLAENMRSKLANFCQILRSSHMKELPVVFTSNRWQSGICSSSNLDETISVAYFGLVWAYEEISLFHKLFEQTSHPGNLSVMIARRSRPGKKFWLTLTPTLDVVAGVIDHYHRILATYRSVTNRRSFCWHPVFSETPRIRALAQAIGLISCPDNIDMAVGNYFVESITSETEFAISNGMSKFLRLPPGTYRYVISHLPNYYLPSSTTAVSSGYIRWQGKRGTRQSISTWTPASAEGVGF